MTKIVAFYHTGLATTGGPGRPGWPWPPTFLRSKKEKEVKEKKSKSFKAETIKRLSPGSKCRCFSHSRASRIQKLFLSANHGGEQYFSVLAPPL